jgi:hypothetical protein
MNETTANSCLRSANLDHDKAALLLFSASYISYFKSFTPQLFFCLRAIYVPKAHK